MRVLIISYFFPPYLGIGAVRVGKTAKYLLESGFDVKVLTARDQPLMPRLPMEIPVERVVSTPWFDVNAPATVVSGGRQRVAREGYQRGRLGPLVARLGGLYKTALNIPDGQIGWLPFGLAAAEEMLETWRPDAILASGPGFTSHIMAARLSVRHSIPWVAEFRDMWVTDPRYAYTGLRKAFEGFLEKRVMKTASGLVLASEPLAKTLIARFPDLPRCEVLNGFDPGDYPPESELRFDPDYLDLVYTGMLYGERELAPLFQALYALGPLSERVRLRFYGRYTQGVEQLARKYGLETSVQVHGLVPYEESLRIQANADVLLLVVSNTEAGRGIYTGKLFEYLGAGRPILGLVPEDGVAADLIRSLDAGLVDNNPAHIMLMLERWLDEKQSDGRIRGPDAHVRVGLSREAQTRRLGAFLESVVKTRSRPQRAPAPTQHARGTRSWL